LDQGLKCAFNLGPPGGIDINLVGCQRLGVSGHKTTFMTEVEKDIENVLFGMI